MCAITGKFFFKSGLVSQGDIHRMNSALVHRGPDDQGLYISPSKNVGLGHCRLSIIDLSPAGHQPMCNEDKTVWIVFNGEIYNFQELRPELERKGHVFRSHTDTETIIHLYEEEGVDCLRKLRGMFAFAIWDEKKQELFLARDRVGKKPLKYYINEDFIVFASEAKAFLKDHHVPREIDEEAIHHYLTFGYVPNPLTGFKNIFKLPPASYAIVKNGSMKVGRYWNLSFDEKLTFSREEWKERILVKFEEAVKLRMIADVPIGAFLSGGVDSSMVVAMMARNSRRPIKTFSIGFGQKTHNELPFAKKVSQLFDTEHTEFVVEPDAFDLLPFLVGHFEEPYSDSSAIPTYLVSQMTRRHVTVALNGDGGDESFAGYPWYSFQKISHRIDHLPVLSHLAFSILSLMVWPRSTFSRRAKIFLRSLKLPPSERYLSYFTSSFFTENEKMGMYTPSFAQRVCNKETSDFFAKIYQDSHATDALDQAFASDIHSFLPDDLLVKVDMASMANALESRSPFLDHELIELAAKIPSNFKMQGLNTKSLLKSAGEALLPKDILYRKKQGFMVPLDKWFQTSLYPMAEELLSKNTRIHAFVQPEAIKKILHEHSKGFLEHGSRLWALLWLEYWMQEYFPKK